MYILTSDTQATCNCRKLSYYASSPLSSFMLYILENIFFSFLGSILFACLFSDRNAQWRRRTMPLPVLILQKLPRFLCFINPTKSTLLGQIYQVMANFLLILFELYFKCIYENDLLPQKTRDVLLWFTFLPV